MSTKQPLFLDFEVHPGTYKNEKLTIGMDINTRPGQPFIVNALYDLLSDDRKGEIKEINLQIENSFDIEKGIAIVSNPWIVYPFIKKISDKAQQSRILNSFAGGTPKKFEIKSYKKEVLRDKISYNLAYTLGEGKIKNTALPVSFPFANSIDFKLKLDDESLKIQERVLKQYLFKSLTILPQIIVPEIIQEFNKSNNKHIVLYSTFIEVEFNNSQLKRIKEIISGPLFNLEKNCVVKIINGPSCGGQSILLIKTSQEDIEEVVSILKEKLKDNNRYKKVLKNGKLILQISPLIGKDNNLLIKKDGKIYNFHIRTVNILEKVYKNFFPVKLVETGYKQEFDNSSKGRNSYVVVKENDKYDAYKFDINMEKNSSNIKINLDVKKDYKIDFYDVIEKIKGNAYNIGNIGLKIRKKIYNKYFNGKTLTETLKIIREKNNGELPKFLYKWLKNLGISM